MPDAEIERAAAIRELVALTHQQDPAAVPTLLADELVDQGVDLDAAREAILDRMAAANDTLPVAAYHRAGAGGADHAGSTNDKPKRKRR